jgi:leucine-rich repeat-containing G protein-coupled receptor 8
MELGDVASNTYLIRLHLSRSGLHNLTVVTLRNLFHLDLSRNRLASVDMAVFQDMDNLQVLDLSGNPLSELYHSVSYHGVIDTLAVQTLDLSFTTLQVYDGEMLRACRQLRTLNVSWSEVTTITDTGFTSTPLLQTLDTRGSQLKFFPNHLLFNLSGLQLVRSDNYKLCCEALLPPSIELKNCHTQEDALSSCSSLLKADLYRVFLWLYAALSIAGNAASLVSRVKFLHDESSDTGFGVLVTNLAVADFLMGVYLLMVGFADVAYSGDYLFHDEVWKSSAGCSTAGFLLLLSREVSVFLVALLLLDRVLLLQFPGSKVRFGRRSAMVACGVFWVVGVVLALQPLLPGHAHWQFFSQTGLCVPFPGYQSERFPGRGYFLGVVMALNFTVSLLVALGLAVISWSARSSVLQATISETLLQNAGIARRLRVVIVINTVVWLVIGVFGLTAYNDASMPGDVAVSLAIFVLPVAAALDPLLYAGHVVLEKRRRQQEEALIKRLESKLNSVTDTAYMDAPNKVSALLHSHYFKGRVLFSKKCSTCPQFLLQYKHITLKRSNSNRMFPSPNKLCWETLIPETRSPNLNLHAT